VSGEGNFYLSITKISTLKTGPQVQLRFSISQHTRDANLIQSLIEYFDCGGVYQRHGKREIVEFVVTKNSSHVEKIIPFFHKYPF
jgi:hypothetical protein